ncbi:MAG: AIR synthase related protein [Synergistaceae bacterium]|nr:AIR synthase related protein [Synergistaceae bacterium]
MSKIDVSKITPGSDDTALGVGKFPPDVLLREILAYRGANRRDVLIGPGIGEDAALVKFNDQKDDIFPLLVISSDPIVGASEGAGRLLVHINANDIACKGGEPLWFIVTLIVPVKDGLECAKRIMKEIDESCKELDIAVIGGHTEVTDRYSQPVIVGTMIGKTDYCMDSSNIHDGDAVFMTRHAGLEGMSIIAADRPDLLNDFEKSELEEVRSWSKELSVIQASRALRDIARVMHDPTEGGVIGGIYELERMSGFHLKIDVSKIPVSPLTRKAALSIGFSPLHLISSGVLLAIIPEDKIDEALAKLKEHSIESAIIGRVKKDNIMDDSSIIMDTHEELWSILKKECK